MPTKTDRILSYLPGTFRALPRPTALYSVADAFGNELLQAENTLAAVMRSHWVDTADQGEDLIDDLARLASLYALAPRDDELVEEFRTHLKHYVRTFLDGTPTVQGILRVAAEALGLIIADSYDRLDTWWSRASETFTSVEVRGDDASDLLFDSTQTQGSAAQGATFSGSTNLSAGINLRGSSKLALKIEGNAPVTLDLAPLVANPSKATLAEIVQAINSKSAAVASAPDDRHLALSSPTIGATSKLAVLDIAADAAPELLGLAPRTYAGSAATSGQVKGTADLSAGADLSDERYLRLVVDGNNPVEIDCAEPTPGATTLDQVVSAINGALGFIAASHDGHVLSLVSPTSGFSSSIQFQSPAAQDATLRLFGPVNAIYTGSNPQPANVMGSRDLSKGVDLSVRFNIAIAVDGGAPLVINCAGAVPSATTAAEIISKINLGVGVPISGQNGKFLNLTSPTQGPTSSIAFATPPAADATLDIFGIAPRETSGQAASPATLAGLKIAGTADFAAKHLLQISVDGRQAKTVDFWNVLANRRAATLADVAAGINAALGANIASQSSQQIVLTSPTTGASSGVAIVPLECIRTKRFVTRAFVTDEAAQRVLGVAHQKASGSAATPARVEGNGELSRGVDLRIDPFLQVSIDGTPAKLIDCSKGVPRPRLALPGEISAAINTALDPSGKSQVASEDGHHLFFTSPSTGAASSIGFQPVGASDASVAFGLLPATVFGHDAVGVTFQNTVDLSSGIDLSAASRIKLAIDGAAPVEVDCAGQDPAHTSQAEIITRINTALNSAVAAPNAKLLTLTSPTKGANSKIEFLTPSGGDATRKIFGITPRAYHGQDAVAPKIAGSKDLSGGSDLTVARFLRVTVDTNPSQDIDCAASAAHPDSAKLSEIISAINQAARQAIATSADGKHLVLMSPTAGVSGKLALDTRTTSGAFARLMGSAPMFTQGNDPVPATIIGTVDLISPVDLSDRRILRLSVDGRRPADVDISGVLPSSSFPDEILAKINAAFGSLASTSQDDHLVLTSPTTGEASTLEILPVRVLELMEYPPAGAEESQSLKHGDKFSLTNSGAGVATLQIRLTAPQGLSGLTFVNRTQQMSVRVMAPIPVGGSLTLSGSDASLLELKIADSGGNAIPVSPSVLITGPLGPQTLLPFTGAFHLCGGSVDDWASLQLNDPQAPSIVVIRARNRGFPGDGILVTATPAALPQVPRPNATGAQTTLAGKLHRAGSSYQLLNADNSVLAVARPSAGVSFENYLEAPVILRGTLYADQPNSPLLAAHSIAALFDVTVTGDAADISTIEKYPGVSIGMGTDQPESLVKQILSRPSRWVVALELSKIAALTVPRGRSDWSFLTCDSSRFDYSHFDSALFAGGPCVEAGLFDVSRFANMPPESEAAVFAGDPAFASAQVTFQWIYHQPGSFTVNLPADLPEKFGARFDQARFGADKAAPETYLGVVMEPAIDKDYLKTRVNAQSSLVNADFVALVPIGWNPVPIPFHHPRTNSLSGGTDTSPAAIYLSEPGVPGFIQLQAKHAGTWGNTIEVSAVKVSPGRFDVTIGYQAARFENARETVFAGKVLSAGEDPLPPLTGQMLKPRPVGVLQGKAAGVLARVNRERAFSEL